MQAIDINGIKCFMAEIGEQPAITRTCGQDGPVFTIRLEVAWSDLADLSANLLGYIKINEDESIERVPPYNLPWAPQMFCVSIDDETPMTRIDGGGGWFAYTKSIITTTWQALTWQVAANDPTGRVDASGLPYTTTRFRVSSEQYSPPSGAFFIDPFGTDSTDTKMAPEGSLQFVRANVEVSMLRRMCSSVKLNDAMDLIGTVNDEDITLADRTFPRGYLLFVGMETEPRNDPNGYPVFDHNFTFLGHNLNEFNEFVGEDGDFHLVNSKADGTGSYPFNYENWDILFSDTF